MTPGEAALRNAPAAFTPARAAFRLSMSASGAAGSPTPIGAVQAGVRRRDRPGSPNTPQAKYFSVRGRNFSLPHGKTQGKNRIRPRNRRAHLPRNHFQTMG